MKDKEYWNICAYEAFQREQTPNQSPEEMRRKDKD